MPTIIEMVNHTRLDCVLGTAAGMRAAVEQATHHAAHRSAFGSLLVDQPLMRNVLADLCVESEAATLTALRLARAYDRGRERVRPGRDGGREVLGLQARPGPRRRGARMPRRQRLRRGVDPAPHLPAAAAAVDLGRIGQRDLPRRAARASADARDAATPSSASVAWRAGADRRLDAWLNALERDLRRRGRARGPRPQRRRADGTRAPGLAPRPPRRRGSRRRVLRVTPRRRRRARLRDTAGRARRGRDRRAPPAADLAAGAQPVSSTSAFQRSSIRRVFQITTEISQVATKMPTTP